MKLLKLIPLLLLFLTFSTNVYAEENCDEIKGNIVAKLLCKTKSGTLIVGKILNNKNINILSNLNLGIRLYTPYKYLEESMLHSTEYSPNN